jgi:excinuclease ABC subunit C
MTIPADNIVAERLKSLPQSPGVYLMKDATGRVIYVGKAASLRSRVRSYFNDSDLEPKTRQLVRRIVDIDFYVTSSAEEALVLELNLIKRFRPEYNIRLKDDKGYPYIKIDLKEPWPRVQVVRSWPQTARAISAPSPAPTPYGRHWGWSSPYSLSAPATLP